LWLGYSLVTSFPWGILPLLISAAGCTVVPIHFGEESPDSTGQDVWATPKGGAWKVTLKASSWKVPQKIYRPEHVRREPDTSRGKGEKVV